MEITLAPMTRPLCHKFYQGFENDPDIFMDMSCFAPYEYTLERVDQYFEEQQTPDRIVFMVMEGGRPVGEVKLKYINRTAKQCSLGIHLQNDGAKNRGVGTAAERLALDYAAFARLDTLIFSLLRSSSVSLVHRETGRGVCLNFGQFPMVAFWTKPGAPFLCLEPWQGCAAWDNETGRFEDKPFCLTLEPGAQKTLACSFHIQ